MMRLTDFPLSPLLLLDFCKYIDYLVLAFDPYGGYTKGKYPSGREWYEAFKLVNPFPPRLKVDMFMAETVPFGGGPNWMEEMLRRLDPVKPDYVIVPEADEALPRNFKKEMKEFIASDADIMVALFEMPTFPEREVPIITWCHHCRAYKWFPGITYTKSRGFCWIGPDGDRVYKVHKMKSLVRHFSLFTPTLEKEKVRYYGKGKSKHIYEKFGLEAPWEEDKK